MATIGLRYAVYAPITAEKHGSQITYGKGVVAGKAISANLTWTRNDAPLNADDMEVANDNSLISGSIDFGLDAVSSAARKAMFGDYEDTDDSGEWEDNTESAPDGGFGFFCTVLAEDGKYKYEAMWLHKVQFGQNNESYQTKGQNVQFQTPTITGKIMGVYNNADEKARVRRRKTFETPAAATAWLNELANVTAGDA